MSPAFRITRLGAIPRRVATVILATLMLLSATSCDPEQNNGVLIQLTGHIKNAAGEPVVATVTLLNSPGWSDYVRVSEVQTSSTGQYGITRRLMDCVGLMLRVRANGYHSKDISGFSYPSVPHPECQHAPQQVNVVLEAAS